MKKSLSSRLVDYLQRTGRPVASGELQRLATEKAGQTGRTCVRRLQELAEEGVLEVEYRKGHAWYSFKGVPKQVVTQLPNGSVRVSYV